MRQVRTSDGKEALVQAGERKRHSGSIGLDYDGDGNLNCEEKTILEIVTSESLRNLLHIWSQSELYIWLFQYFLISDDVKQSSEPLVFHLAKESVQMDFSSDI